MQSTSYEFFVSFTAILLQRLLLTVVSYNLGTTRAALFVITFHHNQIDLIVAPNWK